VNNGEEHAAGRRSAEVFRSLTVQAGMSLRELSDLVESHGLNTAVRLAVGQAELRKRGHRMVEARRRLVEHL
jgi:hypothetical protein